MTNTFSTRSLVSLAASTVLALAFAACATAKDEHGKEEEEEEGNDLPTCEEGQALCGEEGAETCIDVQIDPKNCGACGEICDAAASCVDGSCVACADGQASCNNACADLANDAMNCGECGNACAAGEACVNYDCACATGTVECGDACVNTQNDPANCGTCGNACGEGQVCLSGSCELDCGDLTECNGSCVDLSTEEATCGSCTNVCADGYECNSGFCGCTDATCGYCGPGSVSGTLPLEMSGSNTGGVNAMSPSCSFSSSAPEKAFLFTAPEAGTYVFDTFGSSFDTVLYVRDLATTCDEIACDDDTDGTQSQVFVSLTAGQEVMLVVDGYNTSTGSFMLNVQQAAACPGAALSGSMPITQAGDTTTGSDTYSASCNFTGGNELTYAFTAPAAGAYLFDTIGSSSDTAIALIEGGCTDAELACDEDFSANGATVGAYLDSGQTVTLMVESVGTSGAFELHVTDGPACPANDLGSADPATASGNTDAATAFTGGSCGGSDAPEVSYSYTASETGTYTFDTFGSTYDTVLYVRDASCAGAELGCDDDEDVTFTVQSLVTADLTAGQTVTIFVDGFSSNSGDYVLNVTGP